MDREKPKETEMQCKNRHVIYTINKKQIREDFFKLCDKGILNAKNILSFGNGYLQAAIENWFTGKWWVYFDHSPRHSKFKLHRKLYDLGYFDCNETGCGKCEICRTEHSKEWATKGYCESKMWNNSCFLTITYNNQYLPSDRKLKRSDLQKFWKDLRYHLEKKVKNTNIDMTSEREKQQDIYTERLEEEWGQNKRRKNRKPIRYLNCGEYGPKTKRPHYHAVVWNFHPDDLRRHSRDRRGYWLYTSAKINKIWGKGYIIIGEVNAKAIAYVARYCTKKYSKTSEEIERMKQKGQLEFIGASSLGFIGYFYWIKNKPKIQEQGGILMKSNDKTFLAKIPKCMLKKWKIENEDTFEEYDYWKCKTGKENWEKILSKTDLTESEYITETWRAKMAKLTLLRRSKGDSIS